MKYYIFTFDGEGMPIAYKLQQEGHDVIVGQGVDVKDLSYNGDHEIKPEVDVEKIRRLSLFDNMIKKMPAWDLIDHIKSLNNTSDSFVLFDQNSLFRYADAIKNIDIAGNFPTKEDFLFEVDRDTAKSFVNENYPRLRVAQVNNFKTLDEARIFLSQTHDVWVLKGRDNHASTFIPSIDDYQLAASQILQRIEAEREKYERSGFILELRIPSMAEFTPEKIYYDGEPLALVIDIENKTYGSGNTSIQTGCAQDLVFPIPMDSRVHDIAFPPIVDQLAKQHKGLFYWDASLLIDRRTGRIYFGEFCPNRLGYNEIFTQLTQCPSVHSYFNNVIHKRSPFTLGTVGASVRIFNPDTDDEQYGGIPPKDGLIDFKPEMEKDLWLWDAYKKGHSIESAGSDSSLAVITGSGRSIDEAVNKTYRNVDDFSFVGGYWRPKFDYVSLDYPTSIPNRLNYGLDRGLYQLPFNVRIGELKA
jgi:hypothetical protein